MILLADAETNRRRGMLQAAREAGFPVEWRVVESGDELLEYLRHQGEFSMYDTPRPEIIVIQLDLPGVAAVDVVRTVKGDRGLRSIPVVILAGSVPNSMILQCYDAGAAACVRQPGGPAEVSALMQVFNRYWFGTARRPGHLRSAA